MGIGGFDPPVGVGTVEISEWMDVIPKMKPLEEPWPQV
jgi:hypothetical protein